MSVFAATGMYSQSDDWWVIAGVLVASFLIAFPLRVLYLRSQRMYRIKKQLITTGYKLPIDLAPAELSYVFSTQVSRRHMYATLRDLANRGVIIMHKKGDNVTVEMGPRVESGLRSFEKLLVGYVHVAKKPVDINKVLEGFTNYGLKNGEKVRGSRKYVFWWLLRNELRTRGLVHKEMTRQYTKMLFVFGIAGSFIISLVPLLAIRFAQMISDGEVNAQPLIDSAGNAILFWLIALVPMLVLSFFLLRFKGRMIGRKWLLTSKLDHYLGQLNAYREFVRLTHTGKLRFESALLEEESLAETRPYAIALGYEKE